MQFSGKLSIPKGKSGGVLLRLPRILCQELESVFKSGLADIAEQPERSGNSSSSGFDSAGAEESGEAGKDPSAEGDGMNLPEAGAKSSGPGQKLISLLSSPIFTIGLLVLICGVTFGRTLGSFFLADDIGEIRYIHQIFSNNRWDLFWSNFTGNYMQVPNMSVYRPMLLLTLVFDYLFWKGNPVGYYLSNLLYFASSACLLAFVVRKLCSGWGKFRAAAAGLASSILFVCNPLHCESISWVVGRVDSACCMFYLAAINLFLYRATLSQGRKSLLVTACGVTLFLLGLCVKEMAIGLGVVLAAIAFIFPELMSPKSASGESASGGRPSAESASASAFSLTQRAKLAWQSSRAIWISTVIYFGVRLACLGTLLGGYNGSVGASQSASAIGRWLDTDNWHRLFLPYPYEISQPGSAGEQLTLFAYVALFFLVALRVVCGSIPWRWLAFLGIWAATAAAPIYRLFGLGANLEGARFCFFLTLSLSSLLPILLFSPEKKLPAGIGNRLFATGAILLALLSYSLQKSCYATNLLWLHAGREVKAVFDNAVALAQEAAPKQRIALLGVPKEHAGAHMILNGPTLQMLLGPPFAEKEHWEPFLTFDSILFGDENIVDRARLQNELNHSNVVGPFVWSNQHKKFVEIKQQFSDSAPAINFNLTSNANAQSRQGSVAPYSLGHGEFNFKADGLTVVLPRDTDGVRLSGRSIHPCDYSYLKIQFKSSNNSIDLPFQVRWKASNHSAKLPELEKKSFLQYRVPADKSPAATLRTAYIPIGRQWRWYGQNQVSELNLFLPAVAEISLNEISLLSAEDACPELGFEGEASSNFGVYTYNSQKPLLISSKNGVKVQVQISQKEFFFENMDEKLSSAGIAAEYILDGQTQQFRIPDKSFAGSGYYQVRARALNVDGTAAGDYSDPLTLMVNSK